MRFYDIQILRTDGSLMHRWTSFPNGKNDLNALDVEFDISLTSGTISDGTALVRIYNPGLKVLSAAQNFLNLNARVYGGMQKGLPLANPAQAGLLTAGAIRRSLGTWMGTEQTLDLYIGGRVGDVYGPRNLVFNWKAGTPLFDAVKATLTTAFSGFKVTVSGSLQAGLVLSHDETGFYPSFEGFAVHVKQLTAAIGGGDYPGVDVYPQTNSFVLHDGTTKTAPKVLAFQDLIGQPTWMGPQEVSVVTVLRGDILPPQYIQIPTATVYGSDPAYFPANSAASISPGGKPNFTGTFLVTRQRHLGRFRQADGGSWITAFQCVGSGLGASAKQIQQAPAFIPAMS